MIHLDEVVASVKVERPNAMGIDLHVREIPMIHGMP